MNTIKANTAEEMKAAIVLILKVWASNNRIAANNCRLVSVRQEKSHMATAYEGAADFFDRCQIEPIVYMRVAEKHHAECDCDECIRK